MGYYIVEFENGKFAVGEKRLLKRWKFLDNNTCFDTWSSTWTDIKVYCFFDTEEQARAALERHKAYRKSREPSAIKRKIRA